MVVLTLHHGVRVMHEIRAAEGLLLIKETAAGRCVQLLTSVNPYGAFGDNPYSTWEIYGGPAHT
jgi:hypothetical protein